MKCQQVLGTGRLIYERKWHDGYSSRQAWGYRGTSAERLVYHNRVDNIEKVPLQVSRCEVSVGQGRGT